jgi:intracellular septation protein A
LTAPDTVASETAAHHPHHHHPSIVLVLRAVGRRLVPNLIEATLIPSALFFASAYFFGLQLAFATALVWSYLALARRIATRRPIPALVLLGSIGLTLRTLVTIGSGSSFIYFLQPVIGTLVVGSTFLVSVIAGRPLVARFARDFCPLDPDIEDSAGVVALYRQLTYLWAAVNFLAAGATLTLLCTLPVNAFLAVRPFTAWLITGTGVVLTVASAVRFARREGLLAAVAPDGTLTAIRR